MENKKAKKTMGRRKIEIKKIEKKSSLQVSFTKRRGGLFRKAAELSILCGAEIAILVRSPADKMFAFGHPNVSPLIDRITSSPEAQANSRMVIRQGGGDDGARIKYEKVVEMLEMEKRLMMEKEVTGFWWEQAIEGMELHQLQEFLAGLEGLIENVKGRVEMQELLQGFTAEECERLMPLVPTQQLAGVGDYASSSSASAEECERLMALVPTQQLAGTGDYASSSSAHLF